MPIGIAAFDLQVITTTCYTYATDYHREQSSDIAQLFNFLRQTFGFTFAFYPTDLLCNRIRYQFTFLLFAIILGSVVAFITILGLMWKGRHWRERKSGIDKRTPSRRANRLFCYIRLFSICCIFMVTMVQVFTSLRRYLRWSVRPPFRADPNEL